MKRLGPELKKPEMKVPPVLKDLFDDLRDRRLLPLVGLLVVAIIAAPFLLGQDPEETESHVSGGPEATPASQLTVVQATPGLRDYRKRLKARTPTDPFDPRFDSPVLKGAQLNEPAEGSEEGSSSGAASLEGGSSGRTDGSEPTDGDSGTPASGGKPPVTVVAWSVDLGIWRSGGTTEEARKKSQKAEPYMKDGVLPQTPLPSKKAPVVTYLGPAREGTGVSGKALFLVSREVVSVFGDVYCAEGEEVCQLIEVPVGESVSFVYGQSEVIYTIVVRSINQVTSDAASK
ncbi:MAG TPA: hypothetical protein VLI94_07055 [Solirubrobacterales bacterium]|nr:hypothetical protein [Solirubrobacterales bacterium]